MRTSGTVPGYVTVNTTTRAISIQPENTHVGDDSFTWRARNTHGTDDLTVNITVHGAPNRLSPRSRTQPERIRRLRLRQHRRFLGCSEHRRHTHPLPSGIPTRLSRLASGWDDHTNQSIYRQLSRRWKTIQSRYERRTGVGIAVGRAQPPQQPMAPQTQYAYRLNNSSSNPPTFTASASTFYIYSVEDMRTNNSEICSDFLDLLLGTDVTHGYGDVCSRLKARQHPISRGLCVAQLFS